MCGRFVHFKNIDQLKTYFPIDWVECETLKNCNVAPTQEVLAINHQEGA